MAALSDADRRFGYGVRHDSWISNSTARFELCSAAGFLPHDASGYIDTRLTDRAAPPASKYSLNMKIVKLEVEHQTSCHVPRSITFAKIRIRNVVQHKHYSNDIGLLETMVDDYLRIQETLSPRLYLRRRWRSARRTLTAFATIYILQGICLGISSLYSLSRYRGTSIVCHSGTPC